MGVWDDDGGGMRWCLCGFLKSWNTSLYFHLTVGSTDSRPASMSAMKASVACSLLVSRMAYGVSTVAMVFDDDKSAEMAVVEAASFAPFCWDFLRFLGSSSARELLPLLEQQESSVPHDSEGSGCVSTLPDLVVLFSLLLITTICCVMIVAVVTTIF